MSFWIATGKDPIVDECPNRLLEEPLLAGKLEIHRPSLDGRATVSMKLLLEAAPFSESPVESAQSRWPISRMPRSPSG